MLRRPSITVSALTRARYCGGQATPALARCECAMPGIAARRTTAAAPATAALMGAIFNEPPSYPAVARPAALELERQSLRRCSDDLAVAWASGPSVQPQFGPLIVPRYWLPSHAGRIQSENEPTG